MANLDELLQFKEFAMQKGGYSEKQIDEFITQEMRRGQAATAVQRGWQTPGEAIEEMGYGFVPRLEQLNIPAQRREPLSGEQARILGYISSGISAADNIMKILDPDEDVEGLEGRGALRTKAATMGVFPRDLRFEYQQMKESIGRLHSQGAINAQERKEFEAMLPGALDDDDTIKRKIENFKDEFTTVLYFMGIDESELAIRQQVEAGKTPEEAAQIAEVGYTVGGEVPPTATGGLPETPQALAAGPVADEVIAQDEGLAEQPEPLADMILDDTVNFERYGEESWKALGGDLTPEEYEEAMKEAYLGDLTPGQRAIKEYGDWIPPTLSMIAGFSGYAVGGAGGTVAFPGVGTVSGALGVGALGSGAGWGTGLAIQRNLERLAGLQPGEMGQMTQGQLALEATAEPLAAAAFDYYGAKLLGLVGGLTSKALKPVKEPIKKGAKRVAYKVFPFAEDWGQRWTTRSVKPTRTQLRDFKDTTNQDLPEFMIEKGLFSLNEDKVWKLINPMQDAFDDVVYNSGRTVDPWDVFYRFADQIDIYRSSISPTVRAKADLLEEAANNFIKKYGARAAVGIDELTDERRLIKKFITKRQWKLDPDVASLNADIYRAYNTEIRRAVSDLVHPEYGNLKNMGVELRNLYEFLDIVNAQKYNSRGTLPVGLLPTIGLAGAGTAVGALSGGVSDWEDVTRTLAFTVGLPWLINNPRTITFIAKNLARAGNVTVHLPVSQQNAVIMEVFRRLLTNLGLMKYAHFGESAGMEQQQALPEPTPTGLPAIQPY